MAMIVCFSINLFSNEKVSEQTQVNNGSGFSFAISNSNDTPAKFASSSHMKNPEQMIKLGKYLTMTGVASFSSSVFFLTAAALLTYFAWNEVDPSTWNETYKGKGDFWYSVMMQKNNPKFTWLSAFAIGGFVLGGLTLLMTVLVIPGIILWAIGAGAREKSSDGDNAEETKTSFKPFVDGNSVGLSINL